jgi:hypothetical protein
LRDAFDRIALGTERLLQRQIARLCRQMAGQPPRAVRRRTPEHRSTRVSDAASC